MEKTKRLKTFSGAAAAAVVSLLILVLNLLGVWRGCVFRAVTGIACPYLRDDARLFVAA